MKTLLIALCFVCMMEQYSEAKCKKNCNKTVIVIVEKEKGPKTFHQSYMEHLDRQAYQKQIDRMGPPKPQYHNKRGTAGQRARQQGW